MSLAQVPSLFSPCLFIAANIETRHFLNMPKQRTLHVTLHFVFSNISVLSLHSDSVEPLLHKNVIGQGRINRGGGAFFYSNFEFIILNV